jgi:magnesium transporter
MGFLQICAGVILLQLSKSAKDVPDAAVFAGDLDQVRTVAEQEEPEYEPRADTIRGSASILRSLSKNRTEKEVMEAKRIKEEHMEPIGENEQIEWDGLRRRRTILDPDRAPTLVRRKTIHPPLGMSHFPPPDDSNSEDDDIHPGFFRRLRSRGKSRDGAHHSTSPVGLNQLPVPPPKDTPPGTAAGSHVYGLPAALRNQDTSYKPQTPSPVIQWGPTPSPPQHQRQKSGDGINQLRPPPHTAKRQFSFQNVFHRNRSDSTPSRPTSRGSRKGSREKVPTDGATEEERLGLVKGDSSSRVHLQVPRETSPPNYSDTDDGWGSSPEQSRRQAPGMLPGFEFERNRGMRRVETEDSELERSESEKEKDVEKGGGSGAFL